MSGAADREAGDTAVAVAGSRPLPRVLSIAPGRPFLDTLAAAILAGELPVAGSAPPKSLDLPAITVILPTRRAVRALQAAFLRASGTRALLLPRLLPVGEGDDDLAFFAGFTAGSGTEELMAVPPALGGVERQLALARLVLAWSAVARRTGEPGDPYAGAGRDTPAQALQLAADLARLIDELDTEGASLDQLADMVPDDLSAHWQATVEFLAIVTRFWPQHLSECGRISPAARRNRIIALEGERLARGTGGPVIVAGVTGSVPATVALMDVVARLPDGAVVLPALDGDLDEATWAQLGDHPEHPQHGLARLLRRIGVHRRDVRELGSAGTPPRPAAALRGRLVSEAMRPAGTIDRWAALTGTLDPAALGVALSGLSRIEAPSAADEAEAVALLMRAALETPGRTAALVTPDRLLARRVAGRLAGMGIEVDDSAGVPLAKTPPGAFLELITTVIAEGFAPSPLMALLKHPLTRLGLPAGEVRRAARALEIAAFRTLYLGEGLAGIADALERARRDVVEGRRRHAAARRLGEADWARASELLARLQDAFASYHSLAPHDQRPLPLHRIAAAHADVAEALARLPAEAEDATAGAASPLWHGEAGEVAERLLRTLMDATLATPEITAAGYPEVYRVLSRQETVRPRVPVHPRLAIWGPFEARLQAADLVILGSLNEGTWPELAATGAWLNRPMRAAIGLPAPEAETGRAAHDFTALLAAPEVVLTRALRQDGAPTVPSRWLLRLDALLAGLGLANAINTPPALAWARHRDSFEPATEPARPPEPRPPLALRPRRLSITEIEGWIANPYGVFARHVLRLEPLPALDERPGPAQRGTIVHEAVARFTRRHPVGLPADPAAELVETARDILMELAASPRAIAFWLPRLVRFAEWLAASEPGRRIDGGTVRAEVPGILVIAAPGGPFSISARADRLDIAGGGLIITDYKTGALPADQQVLSGRSPQLPLEAAIAAAGGFDGIAADSRVGGLRYIRATGGEPAGEERLVKCPDIAALAAFAVEQLTRLVTLFDDPATGYRATRRAGFSYDYDAYAHLARAAEWSGDRLAETSEEEAA